MAWKTPVRRPRLVVAGRGRRPRVDDDGGRPARCLVARAGVRRRDRTRSGQRRGLQDSLDPAARSIRRTAGHRRRRSSTATASTCTSAPTARPRSRSTGAILWKSPLRLSVATRRRRIADRLWRSVDLQLRRQRRGVRRGARQEHRQGEVEDQSRLSRGSGLHHAARHSRRRSRSADQRRRLSHPRLRPADGQGDLACPLRRGILERAAAGVCARARLHRHGVSAAVAAGGPS